MPDKLFIEAFEGPNGRAEVFEIVGRDERGVEQVSYEILFKDQRNEVPSMGEASVLASELAGDARFKSR
ncbi:MAG TPA: hypothetical protein VJB57_04835 [Dehalococcoidia bacterium]|nr:hypothetical protein [Dehalococcoidia bacterium]